MNFENYEGTALETSMFEEVEPAAVENVQTEEPVVETVVIEENPVDDTTVVNPEPATPEKYNIAGVGEFTAEEIREMKNGGLRQSDYTRKTQELARQREELKDARELFEYLRANPHIVEAMKQAEQNPQSVAYRKAPTPESELLREIAYNQKAMETDMKLSALKQKYGDVDEVALFQKATELHTDDLEFVYKALNYNKTQLDERSVIEKAKAELKAELEKNREAVGTTVTTRQSSTPTPTQSSLTDQERRIAAAMGLTESEYAKWK